jgi:aminopeptidase N
LKEYEFKSVVQDDLFYVLTAVAHEDGVIPEDLTIKDIMDTWTRQSGYPLIRVSKGFTTDTIQISQERFVDGLPPGDLDRNDLWYVPIATATQDDPNFSNHTPKFWIDKYTALTIQPHNISTWILLNPDAMGFYRVLYDTSLFSLIKTQLETNATVISPASRSQLIDDYFAMAFQGFVRIETAFEVTRYMEQEDELIVWDALFTQLALTLRMLSGTPGYGSFRAYILPKINAAIERLGFNQPSNEKGVNVLLRLQLLDWACALDLESCLEHSSQLLDQWMADVDTNPIPIDLRVVVYCAAVKNGGPTAMEFVLNRYQNASTAPKQKPLLLNALACAKEQFVLQALLDKTLEDPSEFSDADKVTLMQRTLQNSEGRPLVLNFIRTEFSKFINQGINATEFTEFFRTVGQTCKTDSEFKAIEHFIDAYEAELEPIAEILSGTLASIRANMDWMKSYYESMHDWFTMQISN